MDSVNTYSIKYVALRTGLKPHLIRSWESRYKAVCPQRASNQRRCFTDRDILRLRLLKRAVDHGHTISSVSQLSDAEISKLLQQEEAAWPETPSMGPVADAALPQSMGNAAETVAKALSHVTQLDGTALENVISDAAVEMPRLAFVQQVVLPLFETIGGMWHAGKLKIVGEHMASIVIRATLWDMLRSVELFDNAPRIVVATPVGHWHEIGALAAALAASESGWRTGYFGPNLPSEEIAYAVRHFDARATALSLCHRLSDSRLGPEMKKLRRLMGHTMPLFIGGPGGHIAKRLEPGLNAIYAKDLLEFKKELERLAADIANDPAKT